MSTEVTIDSSELSWFPEVPHPPIPYDLSPYTAEEVKETLKHKTQNSAHLVMMTLFMTSYQNFQHLMNF